MISVSFQHQLSLSLAQYFHCPFPAINTLIMSQFEDLKDEFEPVRKSTVDELDSDPFIKRLKSQSGLVRALARQKENKKLSYSLNVKMNKFSVRRTCKESQARKYPALKLKRRRIYLIGLDELEEKLKKRNTESQTENTFPDQINEIKEETYTEYSSDSGNASTIECEIKNEDKPNVSQVPSTSQDSSQLVTSKDSKNVTSENASNPKTSQDSNNCITSKDPKVRQRSPTEPRRRKRIALIPMNQEYILKARAAISQVHGSFDENQPIDVDSDVLDHEDDIAIDALLQFHEIELSLEDLESEFQDASNNFDLDSITFSINDSPDALANTADSNTKADLESPKFISSPHDIDIMKKMVLRQLNSPEVSNLENSLVSKPCKELQSVVGRTVEDGESHIVLLIGPHGLGKNVVVDNAIQKYKNIRSETFITIRLSGSLQATEQHAIREIARQLDRYLGKKREGSESSSFEKRAISDTFANILLTLEAPTNQLAEGGEEGDSKEVPIRVIFVIDEIEAYINTSKQMLLYNLFEFTQNPRVPICVIGVTTKVNIRDVFEKRIGSRFSQRTITTQLSSTVEEYWANASSALKIDEGKFHSFNDEQYPKLWNSAVEKLFSEPSGLRNAIYRCFFSTKSTAQFKQASMLPVMQINSQQPFLEGTDFEVYLNSICDGVEAKINACSPLELLMIVAAARKVNRSEDSHVNFNMAFNEYEQMMKSFNTESTTLTVSGSNSNASHIDSLALAGIKVTRRIASARTMRDCWAKIYRCGLLFDALTTSNEVNAHNNLNMYKETVLEDSRILQLDILLDEVRLLVAGDSFLERLVKI